MWIHTKAPRGNEKIVLAQLIDNKAEETGGDALHHKINNPLTHVIQALEGGHNHELTLFCMNLLRSDWRKQVLSGELDVKGESNLLEGVNKALASQQKIIDSLGVKVIKNIPDTIKTPFDICSLDLMLQEILANALAHANEGSEINIEAQESDGDVKLQITDKGKGLPTSSISMVWDEGYVGENAGGVFKNAEGLGLTVVKKCMSRYQSGSLY